MHRVLQRLGVRSAARLDWPTRTIDPLRRTPRRAPERGHQEARSERRVSGTRACGARTRIEWTAMTSSMPRWMTASWPARNSQSDERKDKAATFINGRWVIRSASVPIERVLTDNGSCYGTHAPAEALARHGIEHRSLLYRPQSNGKVKPSNQTLKLECAYARALTDKASRTAELERWAASLHHHRPQMPLKGQAPITVLNNVSREHSKNNVSREHSPRTVRGGCRSIAWRQSLASATRRNGSNTQKLRQASKKSLRFEPKPPIQALSTLSVDQKPKRGFQSRSLPHLMGSGRLDHEAPPPSELGEHVDRSSRLRLHPPQGLETPDASSVLDDFCCGRDVASVLGGEDRSARRSRRCFHVGLLESPQTCGWRR